MVGPTGQGPGCRSPAAAAATTGVELDHRPLVAHATKEGGHSHRHTSPAAGSTAAVHHPGPPPRRPAPPPRPPTAPPHRQNPSARAPAAVKTAQGGPLSHRPGEEQGGEPHLDDDGGRRALVRAGGALPTPARDPGGQGPAAPFPGAGRLCRRRPRGATRRGMREESRRRGGWGRRSPAAWRGGARSGRGGEGEGRGGTGGADAGGG